MRSFPVELVEQICSYLCFHCQNPGAFPNADDPDVVCSKATLARLARVCKGIHKVVRPYVYHYYATGNLHTLKHDRDDIPDSADDKLPIFLYTILKYPDLAKRVESLQLVQSHVIPGYTKDVASALEAASKAAGVVTNIPKGLGQPKPKPKRRRGIAFPVPYSRRGKWGKFDRELRAHAWLQDLALLHLPGAKRILLSRSWGFGFPSLEESDRPVSGVETLALRPFWEEYGRIDHAPLLASCPRLTTVLVLDEGYHPLVPLDRGALPTIRKLMYSSSGDSADYLLDWCSGLEELHLHVESHTHIWFSGAAIRTLGRLAPTLRKFCLTFHQDFAFENGPSYERMDRTRWLPMDDLSIITFANVSALEVLVLDQIALYPRRDRAWVPNLIDILPSSLQELHLLSVYKSNLEHLRELAGEAPVRFPRLRLVHLSLTERIDPSRDAEMEELKLIEPIFRRVGVEVRWSTCAVGGKPWVSIPGLAPETPRDPRMRLPYPLIF